jgi:hypothetical protein
MVDRCLRWLEFRELYSPCYQSDLKIIEGVVSRFLDRDATSGRPHVDNCWAGYCEIAFPIVIHGHLVGAVMTGQFDTEVSPATAEDFIARECTWRDSRIFASQTESALSAHHEILRGGFQEWRESGKPGYVLSEQLAEALREDVRHLVILGERS